MIAEFFNGDIQLLKVKDIADTLGLCNKTVLNYIRAGRLKAQKIGKNYYITKDRFKEFVEGTETKK